MVVFILTVKKCEMEIMGSVKGSEISSTKAALLVIGVVLLVVYALFIGIVMVADIKTGGTSLGVSLTGAFGDSFGVLTSVFSGLAAYLVYLTLKSQRTELELTRRELESSREAQGKQAIETTIFNLIQVHRNNVSNVEIDTVQNSIEKGERAFMEIAVRMHDGFKDACYRLSTPDIRNKVITNNDYDAYEGFGLLSNVEQREALGSLLDGIGYLVMGLNNYIKHLVLMLDYLNESKDVLTGRKEIMDKAVTAGVSDHELILLFYLRHLLDSEQRKVIDTSPLFESIPESIFLFREDDLKFPIELMQLDLS